MKLRLVSALLVIVSLSIAGYSWMQYLTWNAATELRQVRWIIPSSAGTWAQEREYRTPRSCSSNLIWHGARALMGCIASKEDALWEMDYARGRAELRYPSSGDSYNRIFLPISDDKFGFSDGKTLRIGGPAGWLQHSPAQQNMPEFDGLAWTHGELQGTRRMHEKVTANYLAVTALRLDGTVHERPPIQPRACWEDNGVGELRFQCFYSVTFHKNQWWLENHDSYTSPQRCWIGADNTKACFAIEDSEKNELIPFYNTSNLAIGRLPLFAGTFDYGWEKPLALDRGTWTPRAVVWEGASLRYQTTERLGVDTLRFVIDGKNIDLTYRAGGRNDYEVFTAGNTRAVASLNSNSVLSVHPDGRGGYFIADNNGRYATLDANLARTDQFDIWVYLRTSGDADPSNMSASWLNRWPARWLAWGMFGPLVMALVLLTLGGIRARARRANATMPEMTAAPRRITAALDLSTWWVPALLLIYVITAGFGMMRVVPLL